MFSWECNQLKSLLDLDLQNLSYKRKNLSYFTKKTLDNRKILEEFNIKFIIISYIFILHTINQILKEL